jgi:predicted enzyme related to lactoylglutathione lyase
MGLAPDTITFDCADTLRVATFWGGALSFGLDHDPDDPEDDGVLLVDPSKRTRGVYFQSVPEPKVVKNRVHLDLRPATSMAVEVERLQALGAAEIRYVDEGHGSWTVMGDPEGNELCVLRSGAEGGKHAAAGLDSIVVDTDDWRRVADFWIAALGYRESEDPIITEPDGDVGIELVSERDGDPMLSFVHVSEPKTVKNRIHLDVRPTGSMAEEVERVTGLGATVRGFIEEGGSFWTQMRDPEGNEFCVLRGPDDGWSPDEL